MQIVHRDIKLENILIDSIDENGNIHIKITDFGLSKKVSKTSKMNKRLGSSHYMAPEVLNKQS